MFSQGVSPEYLQSLASAYNQYFPQAPQGINTAALQQWYNQPQMYGSNTMGNQQSIIGGLFGNANNNLIPGDRGDGGQPFGFLGTPSTNAMNVAPPSAALSNALSAYGSLFGGMMPYAGMANFGARALSGPAAVAQSAAIRDALAAQLAANPQYAGGGYGGPGGMTSPTGAGLAANPMGIDPAQAQGQGTEGFGAGLAAEYDK